MPELPSESRRLARRVVQDRRTNAFSRAGGNGLPFVWAAGRISTRKDRAGAAWSPLGEAVCGQGGRVDLVRSKVRGWNVTGVYFHTRTGEPVCELLDSSRSPTSGCKRESQETGAV